MNKFWNWVKDTDTGQRELYLEGVIAQESWLGDEVTPAAFKQELTSGTGPITIHINSVGGDCVAASMIYTMLMDYPSDVNVQIDGLAASAASVVAMAGTHVAMSPTSLLMVHDPWTSASGNAVDMQRAIALLDEVKESIINAYEIKTGLSRVKLSHLMEEETWMNANRAKELGFCDEVLYTGAEPVEKVSFDFSNKTSAMQVLNLAVAMLPKDENSAENAVNPCNSAPIAQNCAVEVNERKIAPIETACVADYVDAALAQVEPEERVSVRITDRKLDDLKY